MVTNPKSSHRLPTTAGFGLIELLVSIGIMVLVTGVVLVNHTSYNNASLLRSQAWEVALAVREVQLIAVGATFVAGGFRGVYGVHFDIRPNNGRPQDYAVFLDSVGSDNFYTTDTTFGSQGRLDPRFIISGVNGFIGTATTSVNQLSITFQRPNYDAIFRTSDAGGGADFDRVEISIRPRAAGATQTRVIEITRTGQISVKN